MREEFDVPAAFAYYARFILNEERAETLASLGLLATGSVHPRDWEAFGAILTRDAARPGYGADLSAHEVKSAVRGSSFEYQYHLRGGLEKLEDDLRVSHVFVSYSRDYRDVDVRIVPGALLADVFESWRSGLDANYAGDAPRQRYRKSVPFGRVARSGRLILQIRDGRLAKPGEG